MKKANVALAMTALSVIVLALGPRPQVDLTLSPVSLPEDLDAYLERSEARFSDLVPGTEKTIIWADPERKNQTDLALVYLHGFSASRQETRPLSDLVARELGANLFYTRLSGHGRGSQAMAEAEVNDWLNDAAEAFAIGTRIGRRVIVVGTSTGATLAAWLAAQPDHEELMALILISPNYRPADSRAVFLTWSWGTWLARILKGDEYSWTPVNEPHERYWTIRFPIEATANMMALVELVRDSRLEDIETPVLVFYSPEDQIVDPEEIRAQYQRIGSAIKDLIIIEGTGDPAYHVLAGEILSPATTETVAEQILEFVEGIGGDLDVGG